ncbi:MAG: hypothetical protein B5M56_09675 [Desulfococcus sp. 4484_241]|nr:MAG: hypothetical protein B5M56_09675 [Desulfococcus sp. 4484_241]
MLSASCPATSGDGVETFAPAFSSATGAGAAAGASLPVTSPCFSVPGSAGASSRPGSCPAFSTVLGSDADRFSSVLLPGPRCLYSLCRMLDPDLLPYNGPLLFLFSDRLGTFLASGKDQQADTQTRQQNFTL